MAVERHGAYFPRIKLSDLAEDRDAAAVRTTDIDQLLGKTQDEFHRMLEAEGTAAGKKAITEAHTATLRDLTELHAPALEQAGARNDAAHSLVRLSNVALGFNYVRQLGGAPSMRSRISRA